jgi:hypothetical protein
LASPVAVIITGFDPEVLQLVPEVPVCPVEIMFKFCAFPKLTLKINDTNSKAYFLMEF